MNHISKSFILLLSESIWIYYGIALFLSVEMNNAVFVPAIWWMVAGIAGYILNMILATRIHYLIVVVANIILLGAILIQNWTSAYVEGSWILGMIVSIAVSFIFVRSASFIYRKSTRRQMLHRFEGNIIFYALLALVFIPNQWGNEWFHFLFILAIFLSLLGMILSLQSHVREEGNNGVEVRKVGQSGWFAATISFFFIGVALVCSLLFLPTIRQSLYALGMNGLELLKWSGQMILTFISWLFSLLPDSEAEGGLPEEPPQQQVIPDEMNEELGFSLPIEWLIGIVVVIVAIAAIWILARFLKKWQPPKLRKEKQMVIIKESWWFHVKKSVKEFLVRLKIIWRMKFMRYYKQPIYWYYQQVQKWGQQNGFQRLATETTKEYIEKIASHLTLQKNDDHEEAEHFSSILHKLNQEYQATYYGQSVKGSVKEYKQLLTYLKDLRIKKDKSNKV